MVPIASVALHRQKAEYMLKGLPLLLNVVIALLGELA